MNRLQIVAAIASFMGCWARPSGDVNPAPVPSEPDASASDDRPKPTACEEDCPWSIAEAERFPVNIDHHATFIHRSETVTWIYVAGGVRASSSGLEVFYRDIWRAALSDSGSVGTWETVTRFPRGVGFQAFAKNDQTAYFISGVTDSSSGPAMTSTVLIGAFDGEGRLTLSRGEPLPVALMHATAALLGNQLIVVGGTEQRPSSGVFVSTVATDGTIGPFSIGAQLPSSRSHHAMVVRGGKLYVVGGFDSTNKPHTALWRSTHADDGSLVGWEDAGRIDDPPWTPSAVVLGDWLYLVGGAQDEHDTLSTIRRAPFMREGQLGAFTLVEPSLPFGRAHVHQTPIAGRYVYSVGGRSFPEGSVDRVVVIRWR